MTQARAEPSWRARFCVAAVVLPALVLAQNYVFGPNVRVNDDPPGSAFHSTYSPGQHLIACRGDSVYLCWRDDRDRSHIYFARSTNGGLTFEPNSRIDRNTAVLPALALDDSGGIHIAWCNYNSSSNEFTYYAKSCDGGRSFLPPVRACDSLELRQPSTPSIAVSLSGRFVYVVRQEFGRILLSRSTDGGSTFLIPDTRVNSDTSVAMSRPCSAVFRDTVVLVAWNDHFTSPNDIDVWFARSTDGGMSFSAQLLLNDTAGNNVGNMVTLPVFLMRRQQCDITASAVQ